MITALIFITTVAAAALVFVGVRLAASLDKTIQITAAFVVVTGYAALLTFQPNSLILSNAAVILSSIMVGVLIGNMLGNDMSLVIYSISAAIADFISFSGGLTQKIISNYRSGESLLLQYLSISIPIKSKVIPIVGIGDLLILGCIFYALLRLKYPGTVSFLVPLSGLLAALVVGLILRGIYVIPFIAAVVSIYILLRKKGTTD